MTAAATAAVRGADTSAMHAAVDALVRLPADNNNDNKFANVGGGGGGGGGGRGTGGRMIINLRSVRAAINKEDVRDIKRCGMDRNWIWNRLNFKQLGKVRVIIFENIFAIVVPVDLSSYIFGRW